MQSGNTVKGESGQGHRQSGAGGEARHDDRQHGGTEQEEEEGGDNLGTRPPTFSTPGEEDLLGLVLRHFLVDSAR